MNLDLRKNIVALFIFLSLFYVSINSVKADRLYVNDKNSMYTTVKNAVNQTAENKVHVIVFLKNEITKKDITETVTRVTGECKSYKLEAAGIRDYLLDGEVQGYFIQLQVSRLKLSSANKPAGIQQLVDKFKAKTKGKSKRKKLRTVVRWVKKHIAVAKAPTNDDINTVYSSRQASIKGKARIIAFLQSSLGLKSKVVKKKKSYYTKVRIGKKTYLTKVV